MPRAEPTTAARWQLFANAPRSPFLIFACVVCPVSSLLLNCPDALSIYSIRPSFPVVLSLCLLFVWYFLYTHMPAELISGIHCYGGKEGSLAPLTALQEPGLAPGTSLAEPGARNQADHLIGADYARTRVFFVCFVFHTFFLLGTSQ